MLNRIAKPRSTNKGERNQIDWQQRGRAFLRDVLGP